MVCAASLAGSTPAQLRTTWLSGESTDKSLPVPSTRVRKELMRLRKKLRDIAKIEKQIVGGTHVDPLQRLKVEKKAEVAASIAQIERFVVEQEGEEENKEDMVRADEDETTNFPFETEIPAVAQQVGEPVTLEQEVEVATCHEEQFRQANAAPVLVEQQQPMIQQSMAQVLVVQPQFMPGQLICWSLDQAFVGQMQVAPAVVQIQPAPLQARDQALELQVFLQGEQCFPRCAPRHCADWPQEQTMLCSTAAALSTASGSAASSAEYYAALTQDLETGGDARIAAIAAIRGHVLRLAFEPAGCRFIQRAFEVVERSVATELLTELHGHVQEAINSKHANYVIQKVIEVMPPAQASFVIGELRNTAIAVSCHRYGCRIMCRLLEHSMGRELIDEVVAAAGALSRHAFAHHVIESIIEHGCAEQQHQVAMALHEDLVGNAKHHFARFVVQAALRSCPIEDVQALVHGLVGANPYSVVPLAQTRHGACVMRTILGLPGSSSQAAQVALQQCAQLLRQTKQGQQLLQDAGMSAGCAGVAA